MKQKPTKQEPQPMRKPPMKPQLNIQEYVEDLYKYIGELFVESRTKGKQLVALEREKRAQQIAKKEQEKPPKKNKEK